MIRISVSGDNFKVSANPNHTAVVTLRERYNPLATTMVVSLLGLPRVFALPFATALQNNDFAFVDHALQYQLFATPDNFGGLAESTISCTRFLELFENTMAEALQVPRTAMQASSSRKVSVCLFLAPYLQC